MKNLVYCIIGIVAMGLFGLLVPPMISAKSWIAFSCGILIIIAYLVGGFFVVKKFYVKSFGENE